MHHHRTSKEHLTRRDFGKSAASVAAALSARRAAAQPAGANERARLGFIGVGNRGSQLLDAFYAQPDVQVAAFCDVYEPYLKRANQKIGGGAKTYTDFRKLLEQKDLDAIVIATPDHWHALQCILACQEGFDVYVEKPLAITVVEGRKMVQAARKYERVVQVGTQRRSNEAYHKLAELVQGGTVGKVTVARAYRLSNMYPKGIGKAADSPPPADLDWDMWLGPRPERPFNENLAPYKFRWAHLYSSQVANWGVHYFDAIRWAIGARAPASVSAHGGTFAIDDDRTIPDTLESISEVPAGCLVVFGQYEASGNPALRSGEIELRGTLGTVYASGNGFEVIPERGGQFQDSAPRMKPMKVQNKGGNRNDTALHARNFLDCIKSRQRPNADVEKGHRSTTFAHLVNIALATKSRIDWDPEAERVTNNDAANKLLHYDYRPPWKLPS